MTDHNTRQSQTATGPTIAFIPGFLAQTSMPFKDPGTDAHEALRENGNTKVRITSTSGLPYGRYARLFLMHFTTQIVTKNKTYDPRTRTLDLGASFRDLTRSLGIQAGGRQLYSAKKQISRLLNAEFTAIHADKDEIVFRLCDDHAVNWLDDQTDTERNTITVSPTFLDILQEGVVPVDAEASAAFRSPMALDAYWWLTRRFAYLNISRRISWTMLQQQFGGSTSMPNFKQNLLKAMKETLTAYPEAKLTIDPKEGVTLWPSKTPIPPSVSPIPFGIRKPKSRAIMDDVIMVNESSRDIWTEPVGAAEPVPAPRPATRPRPKTPSEAAMSRILTRVQSDSSDSGEYLRLRRSVLGLWREGLDEERIVRELSTQKTTSCYTDSNHTNRELVNA